VISGFLITTLLLREREDNGRISLRDFYIRRTLRIFPLYYTVIGLYAVTVFLFERNTMPGRRSSPTCLSSSPTHRTGSFSSRAA
jgi:peptidoglycan/LPS O-acetylase OafA/YrhL